MGSAFWLHALGGRSEQRSRGYKALSSGRMKLDCEVVCCSFTMDYDGIVFFIYISVCNEAAKYLFTGGSRRGH